MAKAVAQDSEGPHERPVVRVQLGGANVHLSKKGSFERGEGEAQAKSSKDSGVDEVESPSGSDDSSQHTGSPTIQGTILTYLSWFLPKTRDL